MAKSKSTSSPSSPQTEPSDTTGSDRETRTGTSQEPTTTEQSVQGVGKIEDNPPIQVDPAEAAKESLWRACLLAKQLRAELGRLLLSPMQGPLRQAAEKEIVPFAGDLRSWPPLDKIQKVIDRLNPMEVQLNDE